MPTVESLCQVFWEAESRYDLLEWQVRGVKLWQYLRMELFFSLAQQTNILDRPHQAPLGPLEKILSAPRYANAALRLNPMAGSHQVDAIILEHDRPRRVQNRIIDIYTYYLQQDLREAGQRIEVLERPYYGRHTKTYTSDRKYLDYFALRAAVFRIRCPVRLSSSEISRVEEIEKTFESLTGHRPHLRRHLQSGLARFLAYYPLWHEYFARRCPEILYLTVSYGQGEVVKAAKDVGITTVELQHGAFSPYHLGYSYPHRTAPLDYFPDRFHIWSEPWRRAASLPLPSEAVIVTGFDYLQRQKTNYVGTRRKQRQIVVLAQGTIGARMADLLWEQRDALVEYRLFFKLHPGQYGRWRENAAICRLAGLPNVSIVEDADLYLLLAESEYQIGVYSTALYEGMEFGCKTVLMELPGIEYTRHLLQQPSVCAFAEFCAGARSPDAVVPV